MAQKSLWDEAYESLQTKSSRLVLWYETILSSEMGISIPNLPPQSTSSDTFANLIDKRDWEARRSQMKELFDRWLQGKYDGSHNSGVLLNDIIKNTVLMTPVEAVLAWVAAYYAASKVVLHPNNENIDDCDSLIYIISRMEWYCHLSKLLHREAEDEVVPEELKQRITSLYAAVLSYLMTVVCSHFGGLTFGKPSKVFLRSQRVGLNTVVDAENALPILNEDCIKEPLEELVKANSVKVSTSVEDIGPPGHSESEALLLDNLNVLDPRLSIPTAKNYPSHQLYQRLLSTTEYRSFQNWDSNTEPKNWLFWVCGEHGQGKTLLLTGIVQSLLTVTTREQTDDYFLSFFFFDRTRARLDSNNPATALRTIIWLILVYQPDLATHLSKKADSVGRRTFNHPNDFLALSDVFFNIIEDERFVKTYIIVDSVDECVSDNGWPGVEDFLGLVTESSKLSKKIKWLISSDGSERFQKAFPKSCCQHVDMSQNLMSIDNAVQLYITAKVEDLVKTKKYDEELANEVTRELFLTSQGNYLWVDIVCEALRSEETWYAIDLLQDVKGTNILDGSLYDYMFSTFDRLPRRDKEYCTMVLSKMALVHDTLRIDELYALVRFGKRVDLTSILKKCSVFLRIDDGRVSFTHHSVKTYVQEKVLSPGQTSRLHSKLTHNCIEDIVETLRQNQRTTNRDSPIEDDASCYPTLNWITHLSEIQDIASDVDICNKVLWFFENYFLEWVENLVLRGQLSMAAAKLQNLSFSLHLKISQEPNTTESLVATIRDAYLFLRLHQSTNTPKNWRAHNTVLYCPEESIIRRMCIRKAFPWLESPPVMDLQWNHNFRTFFGHTDTVGCVAFSHDGKLIASGSEDSSLCIWDAEMGTMQHNFKVPNAWFDSVAISSQGIVAASSNDSPIMIWSLSTGREVRKLPSEPETMNGVCFSNDGSKLAVYGSNTVRIWDLENDVPESGILKSFYIEHPNAETVFSISFGSGDRLLATGTDDSKIRVWDLEKGAIVATWLKTDGDLAVKGESVDSNTLEAGGRDLDIIDHSQSQLVTEISHLREPLRTIDCHTEEIKSIVFSPDSRIIAAGSEDGTVLIWELDAGEPGKEILKSLEANHGAVCSVAFSLNPNECLLVSCAYHDIDIWDPKTGEHLTAIKSPSITLYGLAFSPTKSYFATGASDHGIHLWYIPGKLKEGEEASRFKPTRINDLALSPDGRTLAAAQNEKHLTLWDTETNNEIRDPRLDSGHTGHVLSVSFSPKNGSMLLSSGTDRSIRICDVKTGKLLHRFSDHVDWIRSSAWSPDEEYVASASDDGTVRIWSVGDEDNQKPQILRHGNSYVWGVAFSANGQYVATCAGNKKVLVWTRKQDDSGWDVKRTLEGQAFSILISPDSKQLLIGSSTRIRIYDLDTCRRSNTIRTEQKNKKMRFDEHWSSHVMTEFGAQSLVSSSSDSYRAPSWSPYWRLVDEVRGEEWIMWHDRKVIYIPKNFRPTACGIFGHKIIIGTADGQIHIYRFSKTVTPSITV
ncbi:WD40 repeat-like protein [Annulohypoxylon moriforme]|nr:WD40 repeat-like protein [Annulohypoxylon moriforme]